MVFNMDFQANLINPHDPANWPYGIPLDPKYFYQVWNSGDAHSYSPQSSYQTDSDAVPSSLGGLGLDELLSQRADLLDYRVQMIVQEINERRRILEQNVYSINLDQCAHRNMILLRGEDIWDKYRFKIEQDILGLEENKRREESAYFRDILFLKRELRDSLVEHKEEGHKAAFLNY